MCDRALPYPPKPTSTPSHRDAAVAWCWDQNGHQDVVVLGTKRRLASALAQGDVCVRSGSSCLLRGMTSFKDQRIRSCVHVRFCAAAVGGDVMYGARSHPDCYVTQTQPAFTPRTSSKRSPWLQSSAVRLWCLESASPFKLHS